MGNNSLGFTTSQRISATLERGSIYRIKGQKPYTNSDGRAHHFIVLNYNPDTNSALVLVHGTRGVLDAVRAASILKEKPTTIVKIPAGKYDIFPEETAIDCNNIEVMHFTELVGLLDEKNLTISHTRLDELDLENIVAGVIDSKKVTDVEKEPLLPT